MKKKILSLLMMFALIMPSFTSYSQDFIINGENMTKDEYLKYMIEIVKTNYKYDISEEDLYNGIYDGLFNALDKHSMYFEPSEYEEFNISSVGEFGGIGITIESSEEGYIKVVSPIKNTPGFKAGISTGDIIKEVDGVDIKDWPLEKSLDTMRGTPGEKITLGIQKNGEYKITNVSIIREIIKVNPVESEISKDNIGILTITSFNQNAAENVLIALNEFKAKNIKGLVIDLRNNPGGSLSEVLNISDFFVETGKELLYVDGKNSNDETFKSVITPVLKKMPMAVLINGSSASASEILSGVLQDYNLATVIGSNSYGKGTVQTIYDMPNGSGIKITIAEYLTPSHKKIDGVGIKPNIEVKDDFLLLKEKKEEISKFVPMLEKKEYRYSGETGLNIYGAQQRLKLLAYDVNVNALLDIKTINAIKKFQLDYNLKADGVLGANTIKELEKRTSLDNKISDKALEEAFKFINSKK